VTLSVLQSAVGSAIRQELAGDLRGHWFNYDDLIARTDYHETQQSNNQAPHPQQPSQPNPPPL
jgi:hypothetical protein